MSNYFKYAIGEIVLIVIGILIAVSINNWNEERQERRRVHAIFRVVGNDIKSDLAEVDRILTYYEAKEETFLKVMNDNLSRNEVLDCTLCPKLITGRKLLTINKRGFQQLNGYTNNSSIKKDSIVFNIINFYTTLDENIKTLNTLINNDIIGNLTYWRDTYPWFTASIRGELNEKEKIYFTNDQEYKNKVTYHYMLIYENYLPLLKTFRSNSEKIIKGLSERLDI